MYAQKKKKNATTEEQTPAFPLPLQHLHINFHRGENFRPWNNSMSWS